ncbi:hypothetical protein ABZ904_34625, partial [Streptomyces sp. NPDC046900]
TTGLRLEVPAFVAVDRGPPGRWVPIGRPDDVHQDCPHWGNRLCSPYRHSALTHLGEQGASLLMLMLMAKSRHKKPENVRRYFTPSPESIAELASLLAPGNAHR